MKQFHSIFLLVLLSLSLSSCDLFRKIAGRPTSADIEKKRSALEMEQKAHNDRLDSLKLLQTQISDSLAALDSIRLQGSSIVEARQLTDQEKSRLPYSYYVIVGALEIPRMQGVSPSRLQKLAILPLSSATATASPPWASVPLTG